MGGAIEAAEKPVQAVILSSSEGSRQFAGDEKSKLQGFFAQKADLIASARSKAA
jgi:hypothetical protein